MIESGAGKAGYNCIHASVDSIEFEAPFSIKSLFPVSTSCWSDPRAFALLCDELSMTLKFESEMTLSVAIANATLDSSSSFSEAESVFSQTQARQASTHKNLINHLHEKICDLFQVTDLMYYFMCYDEIRVSLQ